MATSDLTAGCGVARALQSLPILATRAGACFAVLLLTACGGGSGTPDAPREGCAAVNVVSMPGAGNLLSITFSNRGAAARSFTLQGQLRFAGQASTGGASSTLVLTDGLSPVYAGGIAAAAGAEAHGLQPLAATVLLQPGQSATWHLTHAPLPAPYSWSSMRFSDLELCAQ